jgi:YD repeat-containing protein
MRRRQKRCGADLGGGENQFTSPLLSLRSTILIFEREAFCLPFYCFWPGRQYNLRYESRHEYHYDDRGRLIEESWFDNRGVLIFRSRFSYSDNVVTFARNQRDGEIYAKGKYILDEKGRHITEIDGQASEPFYASTHSYEYLEFDTQGNWTKRILNGKYGNKKETVSTFNSIQYRTITYYP